MRNCKFLCPLTALIALMGCASCTRTIYLPSERYAATADTLRLTTLRHDSIYLHDSIYVSERQRGDTVFLITTKTIYRDRLKLQHDTIYRTRCDTLRTLQAVKAAGLYRSRGVGLWGILALLSLLAVVGFIKKK